MTLGGSAKERPSRAWGEGEVDLMNVLRILALEGSICRFFPESEAVDFYVCLALGVA